MSAIPIRLYPEQPKQVYLYASCLVDMFDPNAGIAALQILEAQGIEVLWLEQQSCCGQPAYTSGYTDSAMKVAKQQFELFDTDIPVVVLSGSCAGMLRKHYPSLLEKECDSDALAKFSNQVFEWGEFLLNICQIKLLDKGETTKAVVHNSCSARREMGIAETTMRLLKQMDKVELVEPKYASECCGFGGSFAKRHQDISLAMVADKAKHLLETQASFLLSADWGCLLNINSYLEQQQSGMRGQHIATFIWQRCYGGEL
ncbi:(Fe-S)-binding protein [Alginatibacterium sediminis]|uniref:(Fe-S)-binding protein n=1 Tax=Alginatibacterium sediminis TaxID=2164068 RepID=UPI001F33C1F9|nr:(Fe-S)-binding protein [Alginatibacterium sediminis]